MKQSRGARAALAAAVVVVAGSVSALASSPQAAELTLAVPGGPASFVVDNPQAASSGAARVERAFAGGRVLEQLRPGYTVLSRVIVQTNDQARVQREVAGLSRLRGFEPLAAARVERFAAVDGFVTVQTGTVAQAAALADALRARGGFASVELDIEQPRALRAVPNDPTFNQQWHLRNTTLAIADVNAEGAWDLGYTGAGVTIGILEGGIQSNHPDLAANYSSAASQSGGSATSHGTSCAGIAAAVGNNSVGVAGLAYNAQVSQQIYGGSTTTANAFAFRNDLNDVKSNSWGPFDNGTITYLSTVERSALEQAALTGRGGLGTIMVWAAGNGGLGDRVDYDPYASSRFTFAIGGVGDQDLRSSFNELGSSMLVVTHTSGNSRGTRTTTSGSSYTSNFGGTSSASPLAAGAVGLALEANPNLTWRDMMHVLIESARKVNPTNSLWTTNAAGYDINYNFGFGAIDAEQLVQTAASWTNVAPEVSATSGQITVGTALPDANATGLTRTVDIAEDIKIESVELIITVLTTDVGDLDISLTSPQGTESIFATARSSDSQNNYTNYIFTTHRPFGESSLGTWSVKVADRTASQIATWSNFTVNVYGTANDAGPCSPADINGDGNINFADVSEFIAAYNTSATAADINDDGNVNFADVSAFVSAYNAGC